MSLSPSGRARLHVCALSVLAFLGMSHASSAQCPTVIRVPQDAPTLNSAVAQVCAGTSAEIVVSAGQWQASFTPPASSSILIRGLDRSITTIVPGSDGRFVTTVVKSPAAGQVRFVDVILRNGLASTNNWQTSFTRCLVLNCHGTFFPESAAVEDTVFLQCTPTGDNSTLYLQKPIAVRRCEFIECSSPVLAWGEVGLQSLEDCTFRQCTGSHVRVRSGSLPSSASRTRIERCTFDNTVGGNGPAIAFEASQPAGAQTPSLEVIDCDFIALTQGAASSGGAIRVGSLTQNYASAMSQTAVQGCTFTSCRAGSGGAIFVRRHQPLILVDCLFQDNSAVAGTGGAVTQEPGGTSQSFTATDCTFTGNSAVAGGGAIRLSAATGSASIVSCDFDDNSSSFGGAVQIDGGNASITASLFTRNSAPSGAAVGLSGSTTTAMISGCGAHNNRPSSGSVPPGFVATQSASMSVGTSYFCGSGVPAYAAVGSATLADAKNNCVLADCDDDTIDSVPAGCDCNGDGTWDVVQVSRGELADFDGSGVPDCCESGEPCVVGNYPVQWRTEDGGNGHWYMAVRPFGTVTDWSMAQSYALARGGYLVTVTSAAEQSLIERLFAGSASCQGDLSGVFLGGRQAAGNLPANGWSWVSGEPWGYTNWASSEPNDFSGFPEDYLMMVTQDMRWYDVVLAGVFPPCAYSAVVEWSADCNGDGIVDKGQILRGELTDADGDGVPEQCVPVLVPQQYPTIQAAINAAPSKDLRIIEVAPGTYVESIHLMGKPVRIRGAGAAVCTIQSPVGAQVSVVRASGEPVGAMIEGVTIRGGRTGTPVGSFSLGGGIFADMSALVLKDCIVEDNMGGFGGGAYFLRCTGAIRGCTFRSNSASADGGGLQINYGSVLVEDTAVQANVTNSRGGGIHVVGGNHELRRVTVIGNSSGNIVGGISYVVALESEPPLGQLTLEDCTVTGNSALVGQGGIGIVDATPATVQVLLRGTDVCSNLPRPNITGLWADGGGNEVCDCRGDVNSDGRIDGIDLATLLSQWGPNAAGASCDLNLDARVDGADLSAMLAAWGNCPG